MQIRPKHFNKYQSKIIEIQSSTFCNSRLSQIDEFNEISGLFFSNFFSFLKETYSEFFSLYKPSSQSIFENKKDGSFIFENRINIESIQSKLKDNLTRICKSLYNNNEINLIRIGKKPTYFIYSLYLLICFKLYDIKINYKDTEKFFGLKYSSIKRISV